MTWKDVKKACLRKMYAGGLDDEVNSEIVAAMPQAANEAILALWEAKHPRRLQEVALNGRAVELEMVLTGYSDDCGALPSVYARGEDGGLVLLADALFTAGWLLPRTGWPDVVMLEYEPMPEVLTDSTVEDYELECGNMRATLLPLYMAGSLLKDEDAGQAQHFMNEFEAARDSLAARSEAGRVESDGCLGFDR